MPIYSWKHKTTGEVVEVLRNLDDYLEPPDDTGQWFKLVDAPSGIMSPEGGNNRFTDRKILRKLERERKFKEMQGDIKEAKRIKQEEKKVGKL